MANLKTSEKKSKAQSMGLHTEVLTGKTQQKFTKKKPLNSSVSQ